MSTTSGFTFNGIDFSIYGLGIDNDFEYPGASNRRVDAIGLPGVNKVLFSRAVSEPVEIELPVRIAASSAATLATYLTSIEAGLVTTEDKLLVIPASYTDRGWMARWNGSQLMYSRRGPCVVRTSITFLAQPEKAAATDTTGTQAITGSTTFTIAGAGNLYARPTWTFKNTHENEITAGALEAWNTAVGDSFVYTQPVPSNHYVRFNSETRTAYTSSDGSTWTPCNPGAVTCGSDWLTIKGGVANTMAVLGAVTGTLSWTYTARYS